MINCPVCGICNYLYSKNKKGKAWRMVAEWIFEKEEYKWHTNKIPEVIYCDGPYTCPPLDMSNYVVDHDGIVLKDEYRMEELL